MRHHSWTLLSDNWHFMRSSLTKMPLIPTKLYMIQISESECVADDDDEPYAFRSCSFRTFLTFQRQKIRKNQLELLISQMSRAIFFWSKWAKWSIWSLRKRSILLWMYLQRHVWNWNHETAKSQSCQNLVKRNGSAFCVCVVSFCHYQSYFIRYCIRWIIEKSLQIVEKLYV